MAARSPAFSRTGPDVTRIWAPISRAMMCASVVLPRPGRAAEEDVVERLLPLPRGLQEDAERLLQLRLPDELQERARAERDLGVRLGRLEHPRENAFVHGRCDYRARDFSAAWRILLRSSSPTSLTAFSTACSACASL